MRRRFSLNGTWKYTPIANVMLKMDGLVENTTALPPAGEMMLPVNWQLAGLDNFHGRVRFERSFSFECLREGEASLWMVFRGVDYYAKVWVNDTLVGEHEGYFQTFAFDITRAVQTGENRVRVDVIDPIEEPGPVWPNHKRMIKGVISHWDCRPGSWNLETGQDKNSGGIWNDVYLETRPAAFIGHLRTSTTLVPREAPVDLALGMEPDCEDDGALQAIVLVETEVFGPKGGYQLVVRIGKDEAPAGVAEQAVLQTQDGQRHTVVVPVPEPKLWWTWDLGEPHLEPLMVIVKQDGIEIDRQEIEIGLRELRLDPLTGEWWLNKQRFFVRGTNVVPTLWLGEYDGAMIARDIELLRAAYINGVRVCVHINRDEFYTALDRAGIIVWQDFALQWGYIESNEVTQDAATQIRDMIRLLVNHPCIALWCCQNESTFHNKKILDPVLAQAAAMEDGSRYIRVISEMSEHTYDGWYSGHYRDYTALPATPILTEFGAQALPNLEALKEMIGESWPPDWNKLAYHDFQYDQTFHVAKIPLGNSWKEFVENSQAYQSRLLKYAIELYRKNKYKKLGGMFQFMFMDCWPSVTWSVVGYDRKPKKGYHTLAQVYQPVLIGVDLQRDMLMKETDPVNYQQPLVVRPWVVNDRHVALENCIFSVSLKSDQYFIEAHQERCFTVPADGVLEHAPSLAISKAVPAGAYQMELVLRSNDEIISTNQYDLTVVSVA